MRPWRCSSTKTLSTASERPGSIVKRSRDQSQEAPRRFSWLMIVPPDSSFQAQTSLRNASRPIVRRSVRFSLASLRSTIICVAMPAWSVPGCQSTSRPRMRQ